MMVSMLKSASPYLAAILIGWLIAYAIIAVEQWIQAPIRKARQAEVNTFYTKHNCRPEGYVATKYEAIRTYHCDNGVFITRDMK